MKFESNLNGNGQPGGGDAGHSHSMGAKDLQRILRRILPYWPVILLVIALAYAGARLKLRYEMPTYAVSARVSFDNESDNKNSSLTNALERSSYGWVDMTQVTEKEIAKLRAKQLVGEAVKQLGLYVSWTKQGRILDQEEYREVPLKVILANPDSLKEVIEGQVRLTGNNGISFAGQPFILDSLQDSPWGKIKWTLLDPGFNPELWTLRLLPVSQAAAIYRGKLGIGAESEESSIVLVNVSEHIPARGIDFLQELFHQYDLNNTEFKKRSFLNTVSFINNRLLLLGNELGDVETRIQDFKTRTGTVNLSAQGSMYLSEIQGIDREINKVNVELETLDNVEQYIRQRNSGTDGLPATLGISDGGLNKLVGDLYTAEFEAERLEKTSGEKNEQLLVLRDKIAKLRPSILESIRNVRSSLATSKSSLSREAGKLGGSLRSIPQKEKALLEIERQQQIKNELYLFLLQKREEAELSAAAQVSSMSVIDLPENGGQTGPNRMKIYAIAYFIGLLLAALYIFFKEFSNPKILFRDDLEQATGSSVLGELMFDKKQEGPLVDFEGRGVLAEQFRELRTNINYIPLKKSSLCLLVTSSLPGEGKSFVTTNLGVSLALTNKKVVLLELDLRKPKLAKALSLLSKPGLTNYLLGHASLEEIIQPVPGKAGLSFIATGPLPPNPSEIITGERMDNLISKLRESFDYILIDSPPVGSVTDAKLLAVHADATLYLVRHDYTSTHFLGMIRDLVQRKLLPQPYLVFNGIKIKGAGYGYGGYGYGYGYYGEEKKGKKGKKVVG